MKELSIKRNLDGSTPTRITISGNNYSMHITANQEIIITDTIKYDKIYGVFSADLIEK